MRAWARAPRPRRAAFSRSINARVGTRQPKNHIALQRSSGNTIITIRRLNRWRKNCHRISKVIAKSHHRNSKVARLAQELSSHFEGRTFCRKNCHPCVAHSRTLAALRRVASRVAGAALLMLGRSLGQRRFCQSSASACRAARYTAFLAIPKAVLLFLFFALVGKFAANKKMSTVTVIHWDTCRFDWYSSILVLR
eukprot:4773263-Pleurochrysis_carterae.AAC.1